MMKNRLTPVAQYSLAAVLLCFALLITGGCGTQKETVLVAAPGPVANPAPLPGDSGKLTITPSGKSASVTWTSATDDATEAQQLEYKVVFSTAHDIGTVEQAGFNGQLALDWTANKTTVELGGLAEGATYVIAVYVRDSAGAVSRYNLGEINIADLTAPVPGNTGRLDIDNRGKTSVVSWSPASDNVSRSTNLEYQVYTATTNTITNVADAVANGTPQGDWATNITTAVLDTASNADLYVAVVVRDPVGNQAIYAMSAVKTADTAAPTPGNSGALVLSEVTNTGARLSWSAATDDITPVAVLEYRVLLSDNDNLGSLADAEKNGTDRLGWTRGVTGLTLAGLSSSTVYVAVLVRDAAQNVALFKGASLTLSSPVPTQGNSGIITVDRNNDGSFTLNWTAASDTGTSADKLEYRVYSSATESIATVAGAMANGHPEGGWVANSQTLTINDPTAATRPFYTVLVRDSDDNIAIYNTLVVDLMGPVFGSNVGSVTSGDSTATVFWPSASDGFTSVDKLQYRVYATLQLVGSADGLTAAGAANGTVTSAWTADITQVTISGLKPSTPYHFSVVSRDVDGNVTLLGLGSSKTSADVTAPVVGNQGTLTEGADPTFLSWAAAADAISATDKLQYLFVYSTTTAPVSSPDSTDYGTYRVGDWSAARLSIASTELSHEGTLIATVFVRDEAGNIGRYVDKTISVDGAPRNPTIIILDASGGNVEVRLDADDLNDDPSLLQFKVVGSADGTITTVAAAENQMLIADWSTPGAPATSTLSVGTAVYLYVLARDSKGNVALGQTPAAVDTTPPAVSDTTITFGSTFNGSATFTWKAATDAIDNAEDLQYMVRYSASDNLSSTADIANGKQGTNWTTNALTGTITGLTAGNTYYIQVFVRDLAGQLATYGGYTLKLIADTAAPVPGTLTLEAGDKSFTAVWTPGTDALSLESALNYKLIFAVKGGFISEFWRLLEWSNQHTVGLDWSQNTLTHTELKLQSKKTYHVVVIVADEAGNMAMYPKMTVVTK